MSTNTVDADLSRIATQRERGVLQGLVQAQPFWVFVALIAICVVMSFVSPAFTREANLFNTTRNFAFYGIMALGMTAVIITAGIDLSVGSILGLSAVTLAMAMQAGAPIWLGFLVCMLTAAACGFVNGVLIAYVGLSPFVVTLGMLSIARSLALSVSNNQMIYQFGPDEQLFLEIGSGTFLGLANPVWVLIVLTLVFIYLFRYSTWGRYIFAIGGNEDAARLTGVPVERIKVSVYVLCSAMAGLTAFLMCGWLGSVTSSLGMAYELQVIASTVIGGANLMGGQGYAIGAAIGAALVEVIRNSLLLAGVDPYWQGTFVGAFIILAVLLEKVRVGRAR